MIDQTNPGKVGELLIKVVLADTTILIHCEELCQLRQYRIGDALGFADLGADYLIKYDQEKYGGSFAIESIDREQLEGEDVPVLHLTPAIKRAIN